MRRQMTLVDVDERRLKYGWTEQMLVSGRGFQEEPLINASEDGSQHLVRGLLLYVCVSRIGV